MLSVVPIRKKIPPPPEKETQVGINAEDDVVPPLQSRAKDATIEKGVPISKNIGATPPEEDAEIGVNAEDAVISPSKSRLQGATMSQGGPISNNIGDPPS